MVCNLTGCKKVEMMEENNTRLSYVEFLFCGSTKNIEEQVGINLIPRKNEYLAFIQIRYPKYKEFDSMISNMQTYLSMFINYNIILYPTENIKSSSHFINTAMFNLNQSTFFQNSKMDFVFCHSQTQLDSKQKDLLHYPFFEEDFETILNSDHTLNKIITRCYDYFDININWFDINDPQTYSHYFKKVIQFFQRDFQEKTKVINITTKLLSNVDSINNIKNKSDMFNFINHPYYSYNNEVDEVPKKKLSMPIFNFLPTKSKIVFKPSIWKEFLIKYNLTDESSIFLVLIRASNNKSSENIIKIFSESSNMNDKLHYCGIIEEICSQFNIKLKKQKISKSHLIFYYPGSCSNEEIRLVEELFIGLQSNIIISFVNDAEYEKEIDDLNNVLKLIKLQSEKKNKMSKIEVNENLIVFEENNKNNAKIVKSINEKLVLKIQKFDLNLSNHDSCASFLSKIIDLLPDKENNISNTNEYFNEAEKRSSYIFFFLKLFQNTQLVKKDNDFTYQFDESDNIAINIIGMLENISPNYYSIAIINKYFFQIKIELQHITELKNIFEHIKIRVIEKYVNIAVRKMRFPDDFNEITLPLVKNVENYIKNSVTYISKESYQLILDSLLDKMKNGLYNFIKNNLPNTISKDMIIYIYNIKEPLIIKEFMTSCTNIQKFYNSILKEKQKDVKMDEKQIAQNSMKYILAVKESFKEMTVEISCKEDLEAHIKQDF